MFFYFLLALGISLLLVGGGMVFLRKKTSRGVGTEKDRYKTEIGAIEKEINGLLEFKDSYVSKGQFDYLVGQLERLKGELSKEKDSLREIEGKLETSQKSVEEKETQQQEIKSSNEANEKKLEELLNNASKISDESVQLEKRLAECLKYLDTIKGEITLSEEQQGALNDLNNLLTTTSTNLRDLIMEFDLVKERLDTLKSQYSDLEDEYTRLVEKQLGE